MTFPSVAWLNPISVDPALMVNRERERERLLALIHDHLHPQSTREARILVSGDRGVGKSILTRWVLDQLRTHPPQPRTVVLAIEGRSLRFQSVLRELARQLADGLAEVEPGLARWVAELQLLANNDRITRGQTEEISRAYAAEAGLAAGLLAKLSGRLSWKRETREGQKSEHSQQVDNQLLEAAIQATLARAHEASVAVVVFYDDIDQLADGPDDLESKLREFIDLQHCISILHLRREMISSNTRRSVAIPFEIDGLDGAELKALIHHRHNQANLGARGIQDKAIWEAFERLARVTDNPLVYLRWCQGLLFGLPHPLPVQWMETPHIHTLVATGTGNGGDLPELKKLAEWIDELPSAAWFQKADVVQPGRLSEALFNTYRWKGHLQPKSIFDENTLYCLDPALALLRPSVLEQLRSKPRTLQT